MIKFEDVQLVDKILKSGDYQKYKPEILTLFEKQTVRNHFAKKMATEHKNLRSIDFILESLIKVKEYYDGPYLVYKILDDSATKENFEFILGFIRRNHKIFYRQKPWMDNSLDLVIRLLNKILKTNKDLVDTIFNILGRVSNLDKEKDKKELRELRMSRDYERQLIAELVKDISDIYLKTQNADKIKGVVDYIVKNYNLVDDDSEMEMYSPGKIFEILKSYVDLDFEKNLKELCGIMIEQYEIIWEADFNGWEFAGGGISQSGSHFHISDRHFNEHAFTPAIMSYYNGTENKNNAWTTIKQLCYSKENEVSKDKPDFLNRAIIELLLKRYKECAGAPKKEAYEILKEFTVSKRGIPNKRDLICQYIYNHREDFTKDVQWNFMQIIFNAPWNEKKIATNIFMERIIGELASNNYQPAMTWLEQSIKEFGLAEARYGWETGTLEAIKKFIIDKDKAKQLKGIDLFENFINKDDFITKLERFDAFSVAELLSLIFKVDFPRGIEILNKVSKIENLTVNQQTLIATGIERIENVEYKKKVFDKFLLPLFLEIGRVDCLDKIKGGIADKIGSSMLKKFSHDYAREAIVRLGEDLAKAKHPEETMIIARIFINDPNPRIDDKEFNYHEKIKDGKEGGNTISISTVRGWVCWLLAQVSVVEGRGYIEEIVDMVEKLTKDENYYVRYMSTFPLSQLVRIRHTVMEAGSTERFMPVELANRVESIAFAMLNVEENRKLKAIVHGLTRVFIYMRSLDTRRAIEVLNYFKDVKDGEALQNIVSLFIFFSEFRKNAFQDGIWSSENFDYLRNFDDQQAKNLLIEVLRTGNSDIKKMFAWKFSVLMSEGKTEEAKEELFRISNKYIKILLEEYSPEAYNDIYRFIENNINKYYEECLELFKIIADKEIMALKTPGDHTHSTWRAYYHFDKIFNEMFERKEFDDYLDCFELIMKYPPDNFLIGHLTTYAGRFSGLTDRNERIEKIFTYLIENVSPDFYDLKIESENNVKKSK
ncbi:MAG: hypothetical protein V1867_00660 [Candidatus Falkowbacteria bacterium]